MRDILFRGLADFNGRRNWIFGNYQKSITNGITRHFIIENNGVVFDVDPNTVGQFIDMFDGNGTKIFEGDIIQYKNIKEYLPVRWEKKHAAFYMSKENYWTLPENQIKVIGNIHEHYELLETSNAI